MNNSSSPKTIVLSGLAAALLVTIISGMVESLQDFHLLFFILGHVFMGEYSYAWKGQKIWVMPQVLEDRNLVANYTRKASDIDWLDSHVGMLCE